MRSAIEDGTLFQAERQVVLGQVLWNLLVGGFPARQRLVPKTTVRRVLERDGGRCTLCGAPATGVDHIGSG